MNTFTEIEYPYFKKGQVLKNTDLNNMVAYLDEQNRTSRVLVVGSGIFSGLEVEVTHGEEENDPVQIEVSQGFGLSSDGYIIQLNDNNAVKKIVYTHYKKLVVSERHFRCNNSNVETETEKSWDTFELLLGYSEAEGEDAVKPINEIASEEGISGSYCLILWVSQEQIDRPYCIDICDDNGADLNISIKALLVKRDDLQFVEESEENVEVETDFNPPSINIPAFGFTETEIIIPDSEEIEKIAVVNPSLIENYDDFLKNYVGVIRGVASGSGSIEDAFSWAYNYMGMLGLAGGSNPFNGLNNQITELLKIYSEPKLEPNTPPENIDIQYLFLYLHDLKKAYEEFVHTVCKVQTSILPDLCAHVRYIALGRIEINAEEYPFLTVMQGCRTSFHPSLFNGVNSALIKEVVFLFNRLKKLTNAEDGMLELPVKYSSFPLVRVIPGRERQKPLSKHSIPYYYKKDIKDYWVTGNVLDCPDYKITGYRYIDNKNFFPADNPLIYQDDEYKFFRIEGHVGKNTQTAYDSLKLWIDQYNLPIALKIVYLDLVDMDREKYGSLEMKVLEEKYVEVRDNLVKWLNNGECPVPPNDVLSLQLPDFDCNKLRQWFNNESNCYRPYVAECYMNALTTLSVSYDVEQRLLRDMYRFSEFAGTHPGLQHLGGVHKGGTFVLVNTTVIDPEIVNFAKNSKMLMSDERFGDIASVNTEGISRYVAENASHIVVGDFALPYICCDGNNLIEPFIIIVPNEFCNTDDKQYEILTYPKGGSLTGTSAVSGSKANDLPAYVSYNSLLKKYYFHPNLVVFEGASTQLELTYKIDGLSAKAQLKIYKKPNQVTFELANTPVYDTKGMLAAYKIKLMANTETGFESWWLIDGVRVNDNATNVLERTFYYRNKTLYTITFVEANGICTTKTDFEISLCSLIGDIFLDFEGTPQFSEDPKEDESVKVLASPQGGRFIMKNEDGLHFDPNIKVETDADEAGNKNIGYRLINSAENPLPAGRFFLTYELPVCGLASDPHDFFVQNDPVIVLKRYAFCSNDKQRYSVYLHPADGTIDSDVPEALIIDGGQYFFEPSGVTKFENNIATIKLTCDPPGSGVITQELTVYKVPSEIVVSDPIPDYDENSNCKFIGNRYKFRAGDGLAKRVEWQLNDETKAVYVSDGNNSVNDFEILVPISNHPPVVKLITETEILPGDESKLSNQPLICRNEIIKDLEKKCPDAESVKINVSQNQNKPNIYTVEVNPIGGSFELIDENGNIVLTNLPLRRNSEGPCRNSKGFFLDINDLLETNDINSGTYLIRYSFIECNIAVNSTKIEIKFFEEVPTVNVEVPVDRETDVANPVTPDTDILAGREDVAGIVNSRLSERQTIMNELGTDSSLAQTKTYGLAKMFILFSGEEQELNTRYLQALDLGLNSLKRASGDRQIQYTQIIENITLAYLDKLVISNPKELSDEAKKVLEDVNAKLKQNEINSKDLVKHWKGEDLKKLMNASSVDEIKKVLK